MSHLGFGLPLAGALCLGCVAGCGGGAHATNAGVSTTAAKVPAGGADASRVHELEGQRDDARRRATDAEARADAAEAQHARDEHVLGLLLERGVLLQDAWNELAHIDEAIRSLKAEAPKASAKQRARIEKAVKHASAKREEIDDALRQTYSVKSEDWRAFAVGVVTEVEQLENDLESVKAP